VNASGKLYNFIPYKVTPGDERIDMDQVRDLALQHRPRMIVAGTTSYPRRIDPAPFRAIADEVGAYYMYDAAHLAGLIAGGAYPNPVPHADVVTFTTHKTLRGPRGGVIMLRHDFDNPFGIKDPKGNIRSMSALLDLAVFPGMQGGPLEHVIAAKAIAFGEILTDEFMAYQQQVQRNAQAMAAAFVGRGYHLISGGTDNHLMLIDLRNKNISGKKAQETLDRAHITLNKNSVPFDDKSPFVTSGMRIGVPAVTTRGLKESEMEIIAGLIDRVIMQPDNEQEIQAVRAEVKALMYGFPLYPELG
jgi:glycine hydroxymethyltransferase